MESKINTYRLNQGNKEYIFITSIIENKLRMKCQNSSNGINKKYIRDFTIEQLHQIDEIFRFLENVSQASDYIDKALGKQKVRVSEINGIINIIFYITTNGITNQIDIPLSSSDSLVFESKENKFSQEGNIQNYDISNYLGTSPGGQDDIESLLNSAFTQNNQIITPDEQNINQYFSQIGNYSNENIYEPNSNINNYKNQSNNYENPPIIGAVNDEYNQYFQSYQNDNGIKDFQNLVNNEQFTQNYESNEFIENYKNIESINNNQIQNFESKPYIGPVENEQTNDNYIGQINQILQQQNITTEIGQIENEQDNLNSFKDLTTTKILPIQTSTHVLPPLGPFTSLQGVDLYQIANVNALEKNNNQFQPVQTENNYYEESTNKSEPILSEGETKTLSSNINTNSATNITNIKKITKTNITKKNLSEKKIKKEESEEIKISRSELAELETLRKKVAEMEVLRGQLSELNNLRAQLAEYNAIKSQFKEVNELRAKLEQLSLENEQLKRKNEELEDLNYKYEEEIKNLKENDRFYSMKSKTSNNDNKDIIYEESSQDMTIKGDIIHDAQELNMIINKINKLEQKLTLNLLYKATADSDKASAFHAKCDDAQSTIVLVETDKGKRFGGYTTCSWSGDCIDKKDEDAFVFSLDKMKTYDNIPGEEAVGCYPKFGPIFLGCQIRIYDKAFSKGGTTFERGLNFDTQEDFELTDGDRVFNVKEIEVYEVIKE